MGINGECGATEDSLSAAIALDMGQADRTLLERSWPRRGRPDQGWVQDQVPSDGS